MGRILTGLALVALGAGGVLVADSLAPPSATLVGRNAPVDPAATDLTVIDANNSPTVARNPARQSNLAIVNRIDTPRFSCALHLSFDGGATWERGEIPFPEGEELPPRCFAPDVGFGPDGKLYVSFVTLIGLGNTPNAAWVSASEDGGRTMERPVRVAGPLTFQLRLAIDPVQAGSLWLSWAQAKETVTLGFGEPGTKVTAARSDDGGQTWSKPVAVSPAGRKRVVAPSMAVARGGRLYALYLDLGDDVLDYHAAHEGRGGDPYDGTWSLVLARSDDGGRRWRETVAERALVPAERIIVLFPPSPSLAIGPDPDDVYLASTDGRSGDADVRVWTSSDGGRRFGAGVRVNDTAPRDGTAQYLPRLAVAPGGRVDVVYYDRRADEDNQMNHVSLQWSTDGGRTWQRRVRLTDRAFDSRIGFGSERDLPDLGSRLGLVSAEQRALAVWTDTRAGTEASNKQDLARAVVAFEEGSSARGPLRTAGWAVSGVGGALVLWGLVAGRRRRGADGVQSSSDAAPPPAGSAEDQ